jgi:hypothetical protein
MTTVSQIITDAYRQSNLVAAGASPTSTEETESLRYLNRLVKSVLGHEVGESLSAFPVGAENISRPSGYPWYNTVPDNNWYVPKNTRLVCNLDQSLTLYLHPAPDDGTRVAVTDAGTSFTAFPVTLNGNGNLIENATSVTLSTDGTNSEWFYRADTANWVKYAPLIAADTFPFPEEFDDYFITLLAIRLNPAYGVTLDGQSQVIFNRAETQLKARYRQSVPMRSELGLIRLSRMAPDRDQWTNADWFYEPNAMFEKGRPW